MRTKTLLIAAAALAATVISSEAQTVFSANVVGYVNVVCPAGALVLTSNPLDNGTNTANDLLASLPNKSQIQIWNGSGFTPLTKGATGFSPNPSLPVGTGFFVKAVSNFTNTFVGNVVPVIGGTSTNNFPLNTLVLVGSTLPVGGTFNDVGTNTINLIATLPNKSQIQVWNGTGFTPLTKGATGFSPNPALSVAQGFFVKSVSATNWTQTLSP
jgi:hypothetical protein